MNLDTADQRAQALWAADCAEHVLQVFEEQRPSDDRPRQAVEAARAWAAGEIRVGEARKAAFAAHAAARDADDPSARAAARAAGHAAAPAHVADHARYAATYAAAAAAKAVSVVEATSTTTTTQERAWQQERLAEHLRPVRRRAEGMILPMRDAQLGRL